MIARTAFALLALSATLLAGGAGPVGARAKPKASLSIASLSSRPDLVTGGDALLSVAVPAGVKPAKVQVRRNGTGVTAAFAPRSDDQRRLVGLVPGLREGANLITARYPGDDHPASLTVFNSPITGPILSGPHQTPFICTTEAQGLGPPTDPDCSAPTAVEYRYRSTDGSFKPLPDPAVRPPDLAQTTTRDGQTVDYVIRIESGVINRSIYRWAILAPGGKLGAGWNRRLIYSFGGGCGAGYQQGSSGTGTVLDDRELSRGYSVISSSLTVLGTACNDVLSAETVEMLKEHVIEALGRQPAWTIGKGGSGGSVQAQMIGQNYPGLLDGLLPSASFPDNSAPDYPDCRLLNAYFASAAGSALTDAQREAITGLATPNGCLALGAGADVVNATEGCDESVVPAALIFNPVSNPGGARCTVWDSMVNVYGRDPATGYARRTLDNTGVQYGLEALRSGQIGVNEFLDLNQLVGGYDDNGELVARRSVADPEAVSTAYRTGRINQGAGGVPTVPIIDARVYQDDEVNVHQYVNTYRFRARLLRTNGTYANQVMFRAKGGSNTGPMVDTALDLMGEWLDRIAADDSGEGAARKVIRDKPAGAVDACWTNGGQRTDGAAVIGDPNLCEATYPPHSLPVNQAGKPLDGLQAKCRLRAIDPAAYGGLTAPQEARLRAIFPDGVCDWSSPGVGEQPLGPTWQEFGPQRLVDPRARRLKLSARPSHPHPGEKVTLVAALRPCPEASWQRIAFQELRNGKWKALRSRAAKGGRCRAQTRHRVHGPARFRARAKAIEGYTGAKSKTARLHPR